MNLQEYKYNKKIYTVDYRLKQFRHINKNGVIEFEDFDEDLGDRILSKMIRDNVADISKLDL